MSGYELLTVVLMILNSWGCKLLFRGCFTGIVYTRRQKSVLAVKTHIQTWKLTILSRKPDGSFHDNIRVSVIVCRVSVFAYG